MKVAELFDLGGKVAIVTGGNGGLGLGMALGLAEAGANIVVAARNPDKTAQALQQIEALGVQARGLTVDVRQESSIRSMIADAIDAFGRVDILVNNAGISIRKQPQELSADEWDQVLDVNLRAVFLASKEVYPHMKLQGGGKIINIGSMCDRLRSPREVEGTFLTVDVRIRGFSDEESQESVGLGGHWMQ